MESVKVWARGLFLLAVFSSTALLLVPKSMVKQAKFISELLLLLCVIAPVANVLRSGSLGGLPSSRAPAGPAGSSLGDFYVRETAQRVTQLGAKAGVRVKSVQVATKDGGLALSRVTAVIGPGAADETVNAFKEAVSIYAGISEDKVAIVVQAP